MQVSAFSFELPDSLIARHPLAERRASRLLVLDGPTGRMAHQGSADLLEHVRPGDLMVFNNTRVIPARLFGQKDTGGRLEVLVEGATAAAVLYAGTGGAARGWCTGVRGGGVGRGQGGRRRGGGGVGGGAGQRGAAGCRPRHPPPPTRQTRRGTAGFVRVRGE